MGKKILVEKSDYGRVLLTETLPYETPLFFSNERLYHFQKNDVPNCPPLITKLFKDSYDYTIPFTYSIRQGATKLRKLSLIHPAWQLQFPNFYRDFESLIISLCGKSEYSLRYPARVASHYIQKEVEADYKILKSGGVDGEPVNAPEEGRYAGSFFYYAKYNQLYKFIDSPEFLELEKRFPYLLKFDVKQCFASIYTHSISWATKGKIFAKSQENRGYAFDQRFDQLMQKANYAETNGILVGPELSRIFAELILQQIDLNIARKLAEETDLDQADYSIRRYLDDYFLFCRNKNTSPRIFEIIQAELQSYKLYINESKTHEYEVPFATPQTIAKSDVQRVLADGVLHWINAARDLCSDDLEKGALLRQERRLQTPYKMSGNVIRDLKIAVKRSGTSFDVVTGYALASLTKSIFRLERASRRKQFRPEDLELFQNILSLAFEVVFFLYAMDFRVRTTYLITQFMIIAAKLGRIDPELNEFIVMKLKKGAETVLESISPEECGGVEILNLLLALKAIAPHELYEVERLKYLLQKSQRGKNALQLSAYNYFDLVVLLHYIADIPRYVDFKLNLEAEIVSRFHNAPKDGRYHSELVLLFIDVLACPYVSRDTKASLVTAFSVIVIKVTPQAPDIARLIRFVEEWLSFTDWGSELDLEKHLMRKQLKPGY